KYGEKQISGEGCAGDVPQQHCPAACDFGQFGVGCHNLRHSLASFLVRTKTDPKTVQTLLRHSDIKHTLQWYTHSVSGNSMAAEGAMLGVILRHCGPERTESGLMSSA